MSARHVLLSGNYLKKCKSSVCMDKTGFSLQPWAAAGFCAFAYDIQNPDECVQIDGVLFMKADLHDPTCLAMLEKRHKGQVVFLSAFPVCTDLCIGGAVHWASKRGKDPQFQTKAAAHAVACANFAEKIGCKTWYIENPRGMLGKLWRKANCEIHPCDYGGYLNENDEHPLYPKYIPGRDRYKKRTCVWHSASFEVPPQKPVDPVELICTSITKGDKTYSPAFAMLGGGGGQKTKDVRSATPRGWSQAVYLANRLDGCLAKNMK
jgi:hypothetical protein